MPKGNELKIISKVRNTVLHYLFKILLNKKSNTNDIELVLLSLFQINSVNIKPCFYHIQIYALHSPVALYYFPIYWQY
jgi:hypothetical protein